MCIKNTRTNDVSIEIASMLAKLSTCQKSTPRIWSNKLHRRTAVALVVEYAQYCTDQP